MTYNELMNIREYLVAAEKRLTTLEYVAGISTTYQWCRFKDSWAIVRNYMDAHPELPYVC